MRNYNEAPLPSKGERGYPKRSRLGRCHGRTWNEIGRRTRFDRGRIIGAIDDSLEIVSCRERGSRRRQRHYQADARPEAASTTSRRPRSHKRSSLFDPVKTHPNPLSVRRDVFQMERDTTVQIGGKPPLNCILSLVSSVQGPASTRCKTSQAVQVCKNSVI